MAKINIKFNNKTYQIDESSLADAIASLKSHLSTTMAGSGAIISLGGITYNIDSTKLSTATNDFVAHLGAIAGDGAKINIGGVEYAISSDKVADAFEAFEGTLSDLQPEVLALAPGLYRTGAIALYDAGDYEAASAMLKTSWEQLEADGVIAISKGVEVPDDYVMNEYGFYFGVPYSITTDGMTVKLTFNEDGSVIGSQAGEIQELPTGSAIYGDHSIDMTSTMGIVFVVSPDGASLEGGGMLLSMEILDLPEMNEYGFYFGVFYSTTTEGMTVGFTFNEDGSATLVQGSETMPFPAGTAIYGDHTIDMSAIDGPVLDVSPDGTMIAFDGMILSVGSSSTLPKGTVYLPNPSIIEGDLVLPNDGRATSIPANTFEEQTSLTSIRIPNSMVAIGPGAFFNCTSLVNINLPSNITAIKKSTFENCLSLTNIAIPNSVTSIDHDAFYDCTGLKSVVLGNSVISIGMRAFGRCSSLTSVAIPDSVTSIGLGAFNTCSSLTSVVIPDSVTSINDSAFSYCSSLISIVIPDSVTRIGYSAFSECSQLTDITFKGTVEQWNSVVKGTAAGMDWNDDVPATYVQCSDGQVTL